MLRWGPRRAATESAASQTKKRIERDAARAPAWLRKAVAAIAADFLDSEFTAAALLDSLPQSRRDVIAAFRTAFGAHVADYLALARLEVACGLLLTTRRTLQDVAEQVGFRSARVLDHYCRRFYALTPGDIRLSAQAARRVGLEIRFSTEGAWRWRQGEANLDLLEEIEKRLDHVDRQLGLALPRATPLMDLEAADEAVLRLQLEPLMELPRAARLSLLRRGALKSGRAAFETLSRWSREEGRQDPEKGVNWAEIALALLEGAGEEAELLALGWARLGQAQQLAGEFDGADRAIRRAGQWATEARIGSAVKAEIFFSKGSLRLRQRRLAEAEECLAEAILRSRETGRAHLEAQALQQRAALRFHQGEPQAGLPDLHIALERTPEDDPRARLGCLLLLLLVHVVRDNHDETPHHLREAQALASRLEDEPAALKLRWIQALLRKSHGDLQSAALLLQEARAGFARLRHPGLRAVVALDLALLSDERARPAEVLEYASEALPVLASLELPEALSAHQLLKRHLAERRILRPVLERARLCLLRGADPP